MATTLSGPDVESNEAEETELPDASVLEDKVPDSLRISAKAAGCVALVGFVFLILNYWPPLWHTDLWGHLAYGKMIWNSGSLPNTEPLMPLAAGVPFIDTAWLSQIIGFLGFQEFGVSSLRFLYSATITSCVALLLWRFHVRTRSVLLSVAGVATFVLIEWKQIVIVRPQLAGLLCFIALFTLLTARRWARWHWLAVPALFALWANLHGSFPVGLAMLGAFVVGRAVDVVRRTRNIRAAFMDWRVWRYVLLTQLAAAAVLLNPYGLRLYAEVLAFSTSANLDSIVEWHPLAIRMFQGKVAAIVTLVLIFVYRMSPRRVSATEVLLLVGLGAAALWTSRMIVWWAPVAAYYLVIHLSALLSPLRNAKQVVEPPKRTGLLSFVAVMVSFIFVVFTPFSARVLHGRDVNIHKVTSDFTPVAAVEYLKENPPQGQVFNTYEWGDYLLWNGPENVQIFVASHAHLVPTEVWSDYLRVINSSASWESILDRYGVNTVLIDYRYRSSFIRQMKRNDTWRLTFDDNDRAAVFVRRKPIL